MECEIHGGLDDIKTQTQLSIPEGKIKVHGEFKSKNEIEIAFDPKINVIDLNLGKVLKNPAIGTIAFKLKASGEGKTMNDLNAKLASQFSKLELNGYDF